MATGIVVSSRVNRPRAVRARTDDLAAPAAGCQRNALAAAERDCQMLVGNRKSARRVGAAVRAPVIHA
jgi:hypothetical protein